MSQAAIVHFRKRLQAGRVSIRAWGRYSKFVVEWAVPLDNPDEEAKEQSRTILVKNLAPHTTEGEMYATFQGYGTSSWHCDSFADRFDFTSIAFKFSFWGSEILYRPKFLLHCF